MGSQTLAFLGMSTKSHRLREAETRKGMRQVAVWLPAELHSALLRARVEDRISTNEAVRLAVRAWLTRRKAGRKGRTP